MLKKDGRNLLVNTKIRSIHFVNIMLCKYTLCVVSVFFILLFVCMFVFSFCALPLVNKDVYKKAHPCLNPRFLSYQL